MNYLNTFGFNLYTERKKSKLTQEKLAEACNFHRTYIGLLESGKRNPSLKTLVLLSRSLNCDIKKLLEGID